jgi:hypothetical protein
MYINRRSKKAAIRGILWNKLDSSYGQKGEALSRPALEVEGGSVCMRRIKLVLGVLAVLVAVLVATAGPAMANDNKGGDRSENRQEDRLEERQERWKDRNSDRDQLDGFDSAFSGDPDDCEVWEEVIGGEWVYIPGESGGFVWVPVTMPVIKC